MMMSSHLTHDRRRGGSTQQRISDHQRKRNDQLKLGLGGGGGGDTLSPLSLDRSTSVDVDAVSIPARGSRNRKPTMAKANRRLTEIMFSKTNLTADGEEDDENQAAAAASGILGSTMKKRHSVGIQLALEMMAKDSDMSDSDNEDDDDDGGEAKVAEDGHVVKPPKVVKEEEPVLSVIDVDSLQQLKCDPGVPDGWVPRHEELIHLTDRKSVV